MTQQNNLPGTSPRKEKKVEDMTFSLPQPEPIKGFPELRWTGKRPFTSTHYYPAQLKERYGDPVDGWINRIYWGDNLQVMSHLLKEFRGKVDLVYIDPPFDSKADYKKTVKRQILTAQVLRKSSIRTYGRMMNICSLSMSESLLLKSFYLVMVHSICTVIRKGFIY